VSFLVAQDTKSYQILRCVITEEAPRLDVMDFKIFNSPTTLATPIVAPEDFAA
jgi:hypothetical protein